VARIYEKARIGDVDIHYHLADFTDPWREPPAETFLLYSGYCRSLEFWHAWVPLLGRDYRVLRMDPRGYGESGKPAPGYKFEIEQLAGDAFGLMDHLGIGRVHWAGDSTGGAVGMAAALLAPQRISSITACNTTAKMAQQTVDTYAIGEKDPAAAIEKFGVYEWCRRTLNYRVDVSKVTTTEFTSSRRTRASRRSANSSPDRERRDSWVVIRDSIGSQVADEIAANDSRVDSRFTNHDSRFSQ